MTYCDRCGGVVRGFNRRWVMGIYPTGAKPIGVVHERCDAAYRDREPVGYVPLKASQDEAK